MIKISEWDTETLGKHVWRFGQDNNDKWRIMVKFKWIQVKFVRKEDSSSILSCRKLEDVDVQWAMLRFPRITQQILRTINCKPFMRYQYSAAGLPDSQVVLVQVEQVVPKLFLL